MLTSGSSPDTAAAARSEKTRMLWAVDEKKFTVGDVCLKGDKSLCRETKVLCRVIYNQVDSE